MEVLYFKEYSKDLNRDMEYKIYGNGGTVCFAFPAQNGRFYDYEDFNMIDSASEFIENKQLTVVSIDSLDLESFSNEYLNYHDRIMNQERWFAYVCDELRVNVLKYLKLPLDTKIMTTGISMGAYHALNFLLRRPDLFNKTICLSGIYNASYFFPNYNDELIYLNSPVDYLPNMSITHDYIEIYKKCNIIICVGQGNYEEEGVNDAWKLKAAFAALGIDNAWIDFWGYDVNHDWPWWRKQFPYYLNHILGNK